ncbi:acyltransferase family protein [Paraburkholderia caballeronis]|uniref:Peptidoglycan/LPS O-acetylase OafA/YrhL, contains acyltransferase and SGNH-hydrolase domains n=1 Tax=Paraburkholderia caballeronis TaxID=416943 RepID=A0A1H7JKF3_9BURK|nr:acyltransferase [Paraburkholderia caballeronis]PXW27412.1 peptidoglycan/LPS O-acetylase OafA/YrhL [Paraburkholderia caballeronis]PXX02886.1 peptidoglycan/LPS O-acetylase OafA/YrhL [Paraburkholderia caballeronis]RAK03611.1 peptidoglycan/LPS O-acetylase OafA/YrhL [Paraburkholderia caballeronis]SEC30475.1 Peptidoglycan/LPS O-acetylase OafA/YrhL, contains acyltransferase and SGNH-hydrolase domains [Paraburkholderia caballeronis]SEK74337.1 Peptidoglycan/LPS O-acetylase OafA/YrhL, contains acyltr
MTGAATHVKGLNGLRALAVVLVFLSHKAHVDAIDAGKLGVWLFFLISGYLIIGELHRSRVRIEQRGARRDAVVYVFFMKRALRIFPVYYLLLIALTIAHASFYQRDVNLGLVWHYAFLSNLWIGVVHDGWAGTVSHFWSLAVEQQFYLVAPFVLVFTRASRHFALCVAVVVASAIAHLALMRDGASEPLVYALSPWNFAMIALGGTAAMTGAPAREPSPLASGLVLLGGLAGIAAFAVLRADFVGSPVSPVPAVLDVGLAMSLYAVFLWIVHRQDSALVAALDMRMLAYLGTISYGFYLFHNLIPSRLGVDPALYDRLDVPPLVQEALPVAMQFALAVLLAHLSWQLLEKRMLEWKKPAEAAIRSRLPASAAAGPT